MAANIKAAGALAARRARMVCPVILAPDFQARDCKAPSAIFAARASVVS
jgi:hypothetical protein